MGLPAKYVQPIHFEDFDGLQFERLVFAYHARADKWRSIEWYGQSGSDLGRARPTAGPVLRDDP